MLDGTADAVPFVLRFSFLARKSLRGEAQV
jgi:hypothetical protein